jgi:hypothetical protein
MVQVRIEAKASPTMTVLTTMSAAMNMPHGDRSRGNESMAPVAGSVGATGEADSGGWAGTVGAALAGAFTLGAVGAVAAVDVGTLVAGAGEAAGSAG